MTEDCLFCRIVAGSVPATIVHETASTLAFHDITPVAPVHVLVIPKHHVASFHELDGHADEAADLLEAMQSVARSEGIDGTGYRVVSNIGAHGGQAVGHLHFHVLGGRPFSWPPG